MCAFSTLIEIFGRNVPAIREKWQANKLRPTPRAKVARPVESAAKEYRREVDDNPPRSGTYCYGPELDARNGAGTLRLWMETGLFIRNLPVQILFLLYGLFAQIGARLHCPDSFANSRDAGN